ncbi:peptidoglycan DD-metalloendopeptidase family protein [Bacillus sp. NPDC077027]|uniref:peptidoglycan DD-metalloendopeptidase family protein n=1 Tax=Bacillus sp. NPDC077027 TaxID=3390548 RepID=UPI003D0423EC
MKGYCLIFASCFLTIICMQNVKAEETRWIQPMKGEMTDLFGTRDGAHKGVDIAAPEGESIIAASSGEVTRSYVSATYGEVIFIKHPNGYETVYAHLNKRFVTKGEQVVAGQQIGIIGNTGASRGTHLHFEVHRGNWTMDKQYAIDPLTIISAHRFEEPVLHVDGKEKSRYTYVKRGDTLWSIAKTYQLSVKKLKKINGLTTHIIHIGDRLAIS